VISTGIPSFFWKAFITSPVAGLLAEPAKINSRLEEDWAFGGARNAMENNTRIRILFNSKPPFPK
jgi:hypothetical protein